MCRKAALIWADLIIAKEMNSKFGKAIIVIKDVIRSFLSSYLMKRRKDDENDFSKQNKLRGISPLCYSKLSFYVQGGSPRS